MRDAAGRRDLVASGALPVLALVVCATALVALGASGVGLFQPAADLSAGWIRAIRLLGALCVLAGASALFVQRRRLQPRDGRGPDRTGTAFLGAATIMAVLAVLSWLAPAAPGGEAAADPTFTEGGTLTRPGEREPSAGEASEPAPPVAGLGMGLGRAGTDQTSPARPGDEPEADGTAPAIERVRAALRFLLPLLLALILARLLFSGARRRVARDPEPEATVTETDAEAGFEASLAELTFEGRDARGQITVAYHRLLAALAEAGAPRRPHEAPYEYLGRVLAPLGIHSRPMRRLTELYVEAQFGDRPVTERHRNAAIEALEAALESLPSRATGAAVR